MAANESYAVGIDLGTTYSCVGVWKNNRVEIIPDEGGNRTVPSCVAFSETERLIGVTAKLRTAVNPENTVFDAKRLIGRRFSDPTVQQDMKHWPFKVVDVDGRPRMQVTYRGKTKTFSPEEISSMVLTKMKEIAETFLCCPVKDAVITCPAYFNDSQRQATKDAGRIAGLNVIRVINEPTAAAIAYGLDRKDFRSNIIVFDFGGGTFDVSLLSLDRGTFRVKAIDGDTHLGGEDIDNVLVEYFANDIKEKSGRDILAESRSADAEVSARAKRILSRLRSSCEKAKCALSSQATADIELSYGGIDYTNSISRPRFEDLCMPTFRRCMEPLERVLRDAHMEKKDINEVVLVGGSTRIPRVQRMVSEFFGGKELSHTVNPDEAVAYGAAIQAAILTKPKGSDNHDIILIDVTPLSLGIETDDGVMSVVVPRNTTIPCRKTREFTTREDNQTAVKFPVYEGERPKTSDNHLLGSFDLSGIPPAPRGEPTFDVMFDIDDNGILNVSAEDQETHNKNEITIFGQGHLSKAEIDRMVEAAELFRADDERFRACVQARSKFEEFVYAARNCVREEKNASKITVADQRKVENEVKKAIEWIDKNQSAEKTTYEAKLKEFQDAVNPIISRL